MSASTTIFEQLATPAVVPESTRDLHLAAIHSELLREPSTETQPGLPRRRRFAAAATALVLTFGPGAAAMAAEGTVPGDFLYPVKRVTETIRSAWDDDIRAVHRVEEAEGLVARGSDRPAIDTAIADAETALADVDRPDLEQRLTRTRAHHGSGSGGPGPAGEATTTTIAGSATTTDPGQGTSPGSGTSSSTTTIDGGSGNGSTGTGQGTTSPTTSTPGGGQDGGAGSGSGQGTGPGPGNGSDPGSDTGSSGSTSPGRGAGSDQGSGSGTGGTGDGGSGGRG